MATATRRVTLLLGMLILTVSTHAPARTPTATRVGQSKRIAAAQTTRRQGSSPVSGGQGCEPVVRGEDLWDVAIHPDGHALYVAGRSTDNLFVIDPRTNEVAEVIDLYAEAEHPLGPAPRSIAITPDGSRLVVANVHDGSATVIDTATNSVVKTVKVGQMPVGVAVSPDGDFAYVASGPDFSVAVVDIAATEVVTTVAVSGGGWPFTVAFAPDGARAYVAASPGPVFVLDPATHTVVGTITVPEIGWAGDIVISPDSRTGYLASLTGDKIIVLNLTTNTVADTFDVGSPVGLALSVDGSRLYVGTFGFEGQSDYHLWMLNAQSGEVLAGLVFQHPGQPRLVGSDIQGLAITPDGGTLYAPSIDGECVFVVDAVTLQQKGIILTNPVPRFSPFRGALSPDGRYLYVASWVHQPTRVSVVDTSTQSVVAEIVADGTGDCAAASWGLAVSPDGSTLYVLSSDNRCVLVADAQSRDIVGSFHLPDSGDPSHLTDIAVHPDGDKAYVLEHSGNVHVVFLENQGVITSVETLDNCSVLKISPDGNRGYTICSSGFAVLDLTTDTLLRTVQIDSGYTHFESLFYTGIKPDSSQYLVGGFFTMYVYDAATDTRVRDINLESVDPSWLTLGQDFVFSPDGSTGYLAMPDENAVVVFNTETWQVVAEIDTGRAPDFGTEPVWLLMSPDGGNIYVLNELSDNVLVIDTATNEVASVIGLLRCQTYVPLVLHNHGHD